MSEDCSSVGFPLAYTGPELRFGSTHSIPNYRTVRIGRHYLASVIIGSKEAMFYINKQFRV